VGVGVSVHGHRFFLLLETLLEPLLEVRHGFRIELELLLMLLHVLVHIGIRDLHRGGQTVYELLDGFALFLGLLIEYGIDHQLVQPLHLHPVDVGAQLLEPGAKKHIEPLVGYVFTANRCGDPVIIARIGDTAFGRKDRQVVFKRNPKKEADKEQQRQGRLLPQKLFSKRNRKQHNEDRGIGDTKDAGQLHPDHEQHQDGFHARRGIGDPGDAPVPEKGQGGRGDIKQGAPQPEGNMEKMHSRRIVARIGAKGAGKGNAVMETAQ
jgi:hypothetical protein